MSFHLLFKAFGLAGIASVLLWTAAVALLVIGSCKVKRTFLWRAALGAGLLAWFLSRVASGRVSSIEVDRTEELQAARLYQKKMREEMDGTAFRQMRFAEDTEKDRLDIAGLNNEEIKAISNAVEQSHSGVPAYARGVKQQREAGKKKKIIAESLVENETGAILKMKEPQVILANRLDRYNLLLADLIFLSALGAVLWNYGRRFNRIDAPSYPLPISCSLLQCVSPPTRMVLWKTKYARDVKPHIERIVQRGETFAWFGPDLWANEHDSLPRIAAANLKLWPVPFLRYGTAGLPSDAEFFFDAVWFNRYAVIVKDSVCASKVILSWIELARGRKAKRARARKTVHIVWAFDCDLPDDIIRQMHFLVEGLNFTFLLVVSPDSNRDSELFDLTISEGPYAKL